jgi:hypothetical protein
VITEVPEHLVDEEEARVTGDPDPEIPVLVVGQALVVPVGGVDVGVWAPQRANARIGKAADHVHGVVLRPVVDHDQLEIGEALRENGPERVAQQAGAL